MEIAMALGVGRHASGWCLNAELSIQLQDPDILVRYVQKAKST